MEEKLKLKILLPLSLVLFLLLIVFFTIFSFNNYSSLKNTFDMKVSKFELLYNKSLKRDSSKMSVIINHLKMDKKIQRIWLDQDRKSLYLETVGFFKDLKRQWKITHFYFIGLDGKIFLRVHNPGKFNDVISRKTFKLAKETGREAAGIELGTFSTFALRTVQPWKINGKIVGFIELGEEVDLISDNIKEGLDLDSLFLIHKSHISDKQKWIEGQRMLNNSADWDRFQDYAKIYGSTYVKNLEVTQENVENSQMKYISSSNKRYFKKEIPLQDVSGENIGKIIFIQNINREISVFKKAMSGIISSFIVLGGILFILFYFGIRKIEREIHSRKEKNTQMQKQIFQTSKLASIGELAASVGHEINNPLMIVKGNLTRMKTELDKINCKNELVFRLLGLQREGVERISNIVDSLRTYSRMDTDYSEIIDIHELIGKTQTLVGNSYKREGIKIEHEFQAESFYIKGNVGKFQQILMILLSNSKDAIELVENPMISIKTENKKDNLALSITDNGSGISDEVKEKIFETFFTTKEVGKGTGLGLGLLKDIVQKMDGEIDLKSEIGGTTTFTVTFPLTHEQIESQSEPIVIGTLEGSVLVVDDEEDIREILVEYLSNMGLDVDDVENGEEGLRKIKEKKYDYVCTDMKMPKMLGDEFVKEAKKLPNGNTKYFIITGGVTTHYSKEEITRLKQLADGYILKPFSEEILYRALKES